MKTFQKLRLVKEMITQLVCEIITISKNKMIAIDLGKQPALDAYPKAIQEISFTGNLDGHNNKLLFFIIEEVKETILGFLEGTVKVL